MLPDKLQHQQLVEISVEQRSCDRVEFPVVVVRPSAKLTIIIIFLVWLGDKSKSARDVLAFSAAVLRGSSP